jgi:hypothetical protein
LFYQQRRIVAMNSARFTDSNGVRVDYGVNYDNRWIEVRCDGIPDWFILTMPMVRTLLRYTWMEHGLSVPARVHSATMAALKRRGLIRRQAPFRLTPYGIAIGHALMQKVTISAYNALGQGAVSLGVFAARPEVSQ